MESDIKEKTLYILWTNADPLTAEHMVMLYATNSIRKGWWDKVEVIIWGSTAKLAAENENVRKSIKEAMQEGVHFSACVTCANRLGVSEQLSEMGIEVLPAGPPLTKILKNREHLLTI